MITIAKDVPTDHTISLGAAVVTFTVATHLAEIDVHTGLTGGFVADAAVQGCVAIDMSTTTGSGQGRVGPGKVGVRLDSCQRLV